MVGQLPILFLLTGSDPMSQLQPVRVLQCEAKGHVFLLGTGDVRRSCLRAISSHANGTADWCLEDMTISVHTHLLIGHMFSYLGFKSVLCVFLMEP